MFPKAQNPPFRRLLCVALLLAWGLAGESRAQETTGTREIKVPYALSWGDPPEKVREMIHAVKAREIACSEKAPGRTVLEAEGLGLADPLLRKSVFNFRNGSLDEVELQYADSAWDPEKALDFFARTRRRIDERYGPGTLMVNKVREKASGEKSAKNMTYTLVIYRWNQPAIALELEFYGVEGGEKSLQLVTLHYKAP